MEALTTLLLDQLQRSFRVSIGECAWTDVIDGSALACVQALSADGAEQWTVWAEDRYHAACELVMQLGFEFDYGWGRAGRAKR